MSVVGFLALICLFYVRSRLKIQYTGSNNLTLKKQAPETLSKDLTITLKVHQVGPG